MLETLSAVLNLRVQALSPYSLRVTWDPPLVGSETVVGYSLVFLPVQSHQKRRTHVELFVSERFKLAVLTYVTSIREWYDSVICDV